MNLKIRQDILDVIELNPFWIKALNYNPIKDIVLSGKTHHILRLLQEVYGFENKNPILNNIRYFHYKNAFIDRTSKEIENYSSLISRNGFEGSLFLDLFLFMAKINHFKIYNKKSIDILIKEIIKADIVSNISNLKHRAIFLFYIDGLGHKNIFTDRYLRDIKEMQNPDGAWPLDISLNRDSSNIFSTLFIFRLFMIHDLWSSKDFLKQTQSYLIENHLSKKQTKEDLDKWNRLYSGYKKNNISEGGSVILLEALLLSKVKDVRKIKSLVAWLKSLQLEDGYFPYHASLRGDKNISSTIKILSLIKKNRLLTV